MEHIELGGVNVTDAGLKELARLKTLRLLYIANTPVTDAGVQELQNALPGLARTVFR